MAKVPSALFFGQKNCSGLSLAFIKRKTKGRMYQVDKKQKDSFNMRSYHRNYYKMHLRKWTEREYLEEFIRVTSFGYKYLTRKGFDEMAKIPSMGIIKGLKMSWRKLLEEHKRIDQLYDYASQEYLLFSITHGKSNSTKFVREHPYLRQYIFSDVIDIKVVRTTSGFINNYYDGQYNDTILRNHFFDVKNKIGRIPSVSEFIRHANILPSIYCDYYGIENQRWDQILNILIDDKVELNLYFEQRKKKYKEYSTLALKKYKNDSMIPLSDLETEFKNVFNLFIKNYNTHPTRRIFDRHSKYCHKTYMERLNLKWNEVINHFGYEVHEKNVSEKLFLELLSKILNCDYERNKTWDWLLGIRGKHLYCDGYFKEKNLVVEFDGKHHRSPVPNFGGQSRFERDMQNDKLKERLVRERQFIFMRVSSKENWFNEDYLKSKLQKHGVIIK